VHSWQQELHRLEQQLDRSLQQERHKLVHKRQQLERSWQQERHKQERNPCCHWQLEHSSLGRHHSYRSTVA